MSYEIIIKEKRDVVKKVGKEWVTIGTKEVPRDETYYRNDKNEPKTRIEEIRGYSPEIEKTVTEEREVFRQTVDEMDLKEVIKAVNQLK